MSVKLDKFTISYTITFDPDATTKNEIIDLLDYALNGDSSVETWMKEEE